MQTWSKWAFEGEVRERGREMKREKREREGEMEEEREEGREIGREKKEREKNWAYSYHLECERQGGRGGANLRQCPWVHLHRGQKGKSFGKITDKEERPSKFSICEEFWGSGRIRNPVGKSWRVCLRNGSEGTKRSLSTTAVKERKHPRRQG